MAAAPTNRTDPKTQAINAYRAGDLRSAYKYAVQASEQAPLDNAIRNLAGAIANEIGEPSTAVRLLSESLVLNPNQANAQYLLGIAFGNLQLYSQAILAYEASLRLDPNQPDALLNKGTSHKAVDEFNEAERCFRMALQIDPDHAGSCSALATVLDQKGRTDAAEEYAKRAAEKDPSTVRFIISYANILRKLRRYDDAEQVYRSALTRMPNDPILHCELGSVLRSQNKFDDAIELYEKAIEVAPRVASSLRNAADFFRSIKKNERAIELYKRFIEVAHNPDAGAFNNLAIALRDTDRFDEAEEMYLRAAELDADASYAYNNLAILAMEMAKGTQSIEYYEQALAARPSYRGARSNMLFYMNYLSSYTPHELYEKHLEWPKYHVDPEIPGAIYHPNDPDPDRKLRIGYVSADFCGHAVSYFIESPLKNYDRNAFEVYCYAHVPTPDQITERLKSYVDQFRYVQSLKEDELIDLIRGDKIDILVDLSGHTAGCKLEIFQARPAPVQATWIGYPNTTGLSTIDYRIVDNITDPVGDADTFHAETLYRLPNSFTCYTPTAHESVSPYPPATENGYVTFGSFNNASKISERSVELWSEVLKRVDGSKLLLKSASLADKGTQDRVRGRFEERGIAADRILLHGRMPSKEHMNFYNRVDIALDPTPYNGTTTTCEAMWMGVPVLSLLGDRHAARVTGSLMTSVGLGDLVAETEEDFYRIASDLAGDLDRLGQIRETLRDQMTRSPLCDGPAHTRDLEAGFRDMWRKWCEGASEREQQRRRNKWPANEGFKPKLRVLNGLGNAQYLQIMRCLGCMPNVATFTDVHPLGINIFSPAVQARDWWDLMTDEEAKDCTKFNFTFKQMMIRLYLKAEERGLRLVLKNWSHLDFIGMPFLPAADEKLWMNDMVGSVFDVSNQFIMCHPLAQWDYYLNETTVSSSISIAEYLRGYRRLAEHAAETAFLKVEDFPNDPDGFLKKLCAMLDIEFSEDYATSWYFNDKVTGQTNTKRLIERVNETFTPPQPAHLPASVHSEIIDHKDYHEILRILDYTPDYPVAPA